MPFAKSQKHAISNFKQNATIIVLIYYCGFYFVFIHAKLCVQDKILICGMGFLFREWYCLWSGCILGIPVPLY
jgi:hypothetical protein